MSMCPVCVFLPCAHLMFAQVRRGCLIPWNWGCWWVCHHVGAGNLTWILCKDSKAFSFLSRSPVASPTNIALQHCEALPDWGWLLVSKTSLILNAELVIAAWWLSAVWLLITQVCSESLSSVEFSHRAVSFWICRTLAVLAMCRFMWLCVLWPFVAWCSETLSWGGCSVFKSGF